MSCLRSSATAITILTMLIARPASGQTSGPITIAGLGTITFPTSTTSAAAQRSFIRGVLLLHLFEYQDAHAAFLEAEGIDSTMAMAYWGEAMTYNWGVWNEQALDMGRAALAKLAPTPAARESRAATERERGYLKAVDILYGAGSKARRDTLYAEVMAELSRRFPQDDEARAFHALALLGLSQGVRNVPTYLLAATIAESVFARNPQHPGAAHYWIHGMDDPDHASAALPAARALSEIAPDAGHAQHMTSHIFMALGMWKDVVRANINAMRVVNRSRSATGAPESFCGHYNFWLEYGELQLNHMEKAKRLLEGCIQQAESVQARNPDAVDPDNSLLGSAVGMWARYLIDTEAWSGDLADWEPSLRGATPARATWSYVRGLAAAHRGDLNLAHLALTDYTKTATALKLRFVDSENPEDAEYLKRLDILGLQLEAELLLAAKPAAADSAIALLQQASAIEDRMAFAFGPPAVDKPTHERLGEVLLSRGQAGAAAGEFKAALRRAPGRIASERGLKQAGAL